jgi:uncharacterized glyoxalase superfamily metalloenzyme YdcJ
MPDLLPWQLRAAFARRMAEIYGREVPAYTTLVDVSAEVNAEVVARDPDAAQRLGSIQRVTAERHGAIRVGTPDELNRVARIFAALGMHPVGFYDLREAAKAAVPVVSTAFRPVAPDELARNPFRMFTSLLVSDDRRFFDADLQRRLDAFLARRTLFPDELIALANRAVDAGGLDFDEGSRFLELATASFTLSAEPVDRAWYAELERVSAVAADIGGVTSTHINHLTPRVLDIDELYRRMSARGVAMIDAIQGPPRCDGVDVLLRQTSFRALDEQRLFREADGSVAPGTLRVRFGEVEARGIALTPAGRDRYDAAMREIDARAAAAPGSPRADIARDVWGSLMPRTEAELEREELAYFTYSIDAAGNRIATPIVYEDFLPRSAAGIFQSNLKDAGSRDDARSSSSRDAGWLSDVLGVQVADPYALYEAQQRDSLSALSSDEPAGRWHHLQV